MIVCVCNAITEDELRQVARRCGSPCVEKAYAAAGCELQCCTCLPYAQEIIEEVRLDMVSVEARAA